MLLYIIIICSNSEFNACKAEITNCIMYPTVLIYASYERYTTIEGQGDWVVDWGHWWSHRCELMACGWEEMEGGR